MAIRSKQEVGQPAVVAAGDVDDGEVEHIDHFAVKPSCIASPFRKQGGHLGVVAGAEELAIKHTVKDVAHGSRDDEGDAEQHPETGVLLGETEQDDQQDHDGHNPKDAQQRLHDATAAHPSEGHAWVLDEEQLEPVAQHWDLLA